jgi:hypothetical protein
LYAREGALQSIELEKQKEDRQKVITTDTKNELGTTVAKDLRAVMQGKIAIAAEERIRRNPHRSHSSHAI